MTRTSAPEQPSFRVCRNCGWTFSRPRPTPFCDLDCAGTWVLAALDQTPDLCRPLLLVSMERRSALPPRIVAALELEVW